MKELFSLLLVSVLTACASSSPEISRSLASTVPVSHSCYKQLIGLLDESAVPDFDDFERIASIDFRDVERANYDDLKSNAFRLRRVLEAEQLSVSSTDSAVLRVDFLFEREFGKEWVSGPLNSETGLRQASNRVSNDSSSLEYILKTFGFYPEAEIVERGRDGWLNKVRVSVVLTDYRQIEELENALLDEEMYRLRSFRFADQVNVNGFSAQQHLAQERAVLSSLEEKLERFQQKHSSGDYSGIGSEYQLLEAIAMTKESVYQQSLRVRRLSARIQNGDL